ncbi:MULTISPECIES: hypothetical protein [Vibrio]|uniref:hypothetical protein n=1 Tax=Vibrio TaxID=662 RepID=UPI002965008C|nr:hypothetical protein [Vibrio sp. 947]MDW1925166.1 hypothetical protein [Vibrio sp. 947]
MKSIYIYANAKAFHPETEAYKKYLHKRGISVSSGNDLNEAEKHDAIIVYFGFIPFWKFRKIHRSKIIGEYHSLSTGRFPRMKNILKRILNVKCSKYIFLNEFVRKGYFFSNSCNYIYRPMGYDSDLIVHGMGKEYQYDFVYCGSLNRTGVIDIINRLTDLGYSILIIGNTKEEQKKIYSPLAEFAGKVGREECYRLMALARIGLNYTPDIYPYFMQDSTKVKEYLGAGLIVATNSYHWVNNFLLEHECEYFFLEDFFEFHKRKPEKIKINILDSNMVKLNSGISICKNQWEEVLNKSEFTRFIND